MTHLWTKHRGFCLFTILITLQLGYAASKAQTVDTSQPSGRWVKSDGTEVAMLCPEVELFADRALKLAQGCISERPGVWLSVNEYSALKAELARVSKELELVKATVAEYRDHVRAERANVVSYFQSTSSQLESLSEQVDQPLLGWQSALVGFSAGALVCSGIVVGGSF